VAAEAVWWHGAVVLMCGFTRGDGGKRLTRTNPHQSTCWVTVLTAVASYWCDTRTQAHTLHGYTLAMSCRRPLCLGSSACHQLHRVLASARRALKHTAQCKHHGACLSLLCPCCFNTRGTRGWLIKVAQRRLCQGRLCEWQKPAFIKHAVLGDTTHTPDHVWPPCLAVFSMLSCVQAMYQQHGR
jgi:hypothetical protein